MTGIYKITNLINNKIYIGQSVDIKRRWYYYTNPPEVLDYRSKIISAIKKYGIKNFKFEVLEECAIEDLDKREYYYINFYDSSKKFLAYLSAGEAPNYTHVVTVARDSDGVESVVWNRSYGTSNTLLQYVRNKAAYVRINAHGKGADMIVTINEEITW